VGVEVGVMQMCGCFCFSVTAVTVRHEAAQKPGTHVRLILLNTFHSPLLCASVCAGGNSGTLHRNGILCERRVAEEEEEVEEEANDNFKI